MTDKDDATSKLLKKDAIAETEKILGNRDYHNFNKEEQGFDLARFMNHNETKREHLKSLGDTHFRIPWNDFKSILIDYGFKEGTSHPVTYDNSVEESLLWYHPDKGLILFATSYNNRGSLNGGTCYGEIQAHEGDDNKMTICNWLSTGGYIAASIYETSFDVREGLLHRFKMLESAGTFQKKWINKERFLWLLDWTDEQKKDYDYKVISRKKLKKCPQEMQDILA
jgi:hypothetical protein